VSRWCRIRYHNLLLDKIFLCLPKRPSRRAAIAPNPDMGENRAFSYLRSGGDRYARRAGAGPQNRAGCGCGGRAQFRRREEKTVSIARRNRWGGFVVFPLQAADAGLRYRFYTVRMCAPAKTLSLKRRLTTFNL